MAVGRKVEATLLCKARAPDTSMEAYFCTGPAKPDMARC